MVVEIFDVVEMLVVVDGVVGPYEHNARWKDRWMNSYFLR